MEYSSLVAALDYAKLLVLDYALTKRVMRRLLGMLDWSMRDKPDPVSQEVSRQLIVDRRMITAKRFSSSLQGSGAVCPCARSLLSIADENEAAGAADAWVVKVEAILLAVLVFGSQGGPCDPTRKVHAGGTPAT